MPCKFVHSMSQMHDRDLTTWVTNLGYQIRAKSKLKVQDILIIKRPTHNGGNVSRVGSFMVVAVDDIGRQLELRPVGKASEAMVWNPLDAAAFV